MHSIRDKMCSQTKICFVSLGPTCVPAEILKACNLRTCTFGFDWSRSGSFHLNEFLRLPLREFLANHVFNPNIPLVQQNIPCKSSLNTSELAPIIPVYGYNYFFNPHRDISNPATREYHTRSFERLQRILYCKEVAKIFVIADYTNKQNANFLDSHLGISEHLKNLFVQAGINNYIINQIRITLLEGNSRHFGVDTQGINTKSYLHRIYAHKLLDEPELRGHMYRLLGNRIFGCRISENQLWRS